MLWFTSSSDNVRPIGPVHCSENDDNEDELTEEERRMIKMFTESTRSVVFVTNEVALRGRRGRFRYSQEPEL